MSCSPLAKYRNRHSPTVLRNIQSLMVTHSGVTSARHGWPARHYTRVSRSHRACSLAPTSAALSPDILSSSETTSSSTSGHLGLPLSEGALPTPAIPPAGVASLPHTSPTKATDAPHSAKSIATEAKAATKRRSKTAQQVTHAAAVLTDSDHVQNPTADVGPTGGVEWAVESGSTTTASGVGEDTEFGSISAEPGPTEVFERPVVLRRAQRSSNGTGVKKTRTKVVATGDAEISSRDGSSRSEDADSGGAIAASGVTLTLATASPAVTDGPTVAPTRRSTAVAVVGTTVTTRETAVAAAPSTSASGASGASAADRSAGSTSSTSGPASSTSSGDLDRVRAIKASLYAAMRSQQRKPKAENVSLLLSPVPSTRQRDAAAAATEYGSQLVAESPQPEASRCTTDDNVPLVTRRRAVVRSPAAASAGAASNGSKGTTIKTDPVDVTPKRRLRSSPGPRGGGNGEMAEVGTVTVAVDAAAADGVGTSGGVADGGLGVDEAAGAREGLQRVLKPKTVRRTERTSEKQTRPGELSEEMAAQPEIAATPGLVGSPPLRTSATALEAEEREREMDRRQLAVRNEEYVRFLEGVATSLSSQQGAASEGGVGGGREGGDRGLGGSVGRVAAAATGLRKTADADAGASGRQQSALPSPQSAARQGIMTSLPSSVDDSTEGEDDNDNASVLKNLAAMFRTYSSRRKVPAQQPGAAGPSAVTTVAPNANRSTAAGAAAPSSISRTQLPQASQAYDSTTTSYADGDPSFSSPLGLLGRRVADRLKFLTVQRPTLAAAAAAAVTATASSAVAHGSADGGDSRVDARAAAELSREAAEAALQHVLTAVPRARLGLNDSQNVRMDHDQAKPRELTPSAAAVAAVTRSSVRQRQSGLVKARDVRRISYYNNYIRPQLTAERLSVPGQPPQRIPAEGINGPTEDGSEEGAVEPASQSQMQRIKLRRELQNGKFVVRLRLQYRDRVKRIARKASLAAGTASGAVRVVEQFDGSAAGVSTRQVRKAPSGSLIPAASAPSVSLRDSAVAAVAGNEEENGDADDITDEVGVEATVGVAHGAYNPAVKPLNDAYETVMGVRLPDSAMYGRRAAVMATLTAADIRRQCRAWTEACGKEYAVAFHAREPTLLAQRPAALLLSLEVCSRVFDLAPEAAVQLVLKRPMLVGVSEEALQSAVEAVSEALDVGLKEAGTIVMKLPALAIREPLKPVARRVELLWALLPVSRDKLRQVLRARPQLLVQSVPNLAAFMMAASDSLDMPLFDVALMIAGHPRMTGVNANRLATRWAVLQRVTAQHPPWREQLQTMSPPSVGRCLTASEAAVVRLQVVIDRGLTHRPAFLKFKRILTLSEKQFQYFLGDRKACQADKAGSAADDEGQGARGDGTEHSSVAVAATARRA